MYSVDDKKPVPVQQEAPAYDPDPLPGPPHHSQLEQIPDHLIRRFGSPEAVNNFFDAVDATHEYNRKREQAMLSRRPNRNPLEVQKKKKRKVTIRECLYCGQPYETYRNRPGYCRRNGESCKQKAKRARQKWDTFYDSMNEEQRACLATIQATAPRSDNAIKHIFAKFGAEPAFFALLAVYETYVAGMIYLP